MAIIYSISQSVVSLPIVLRFDLYILSSPINASKILNQDINISLRLKLCYSTNNHRTLGPVICLKKKNRFLDLGLVTISIVCGRFNHTSPKFSVRTYNY